MSETQEVVFMTGKDTVMAAAFATALESKKQKDQVPEKKEKLEKAIEDSLDPRCDDEKTRDFVREAEERGHYVIAIAWPSYYKFMGKWSKEVLAEIDHHKCNLGVLIRESDISHVLYETCLKKYGKHRMKAFESRINAVQTKNPDDIITRSPVDYYVQAVNKNIKIAFLREKPVPSIKKKEEI